MKYGPYIHQRIPSNLLSSIIAFLQQRIDQLGIGQKMQNLPEEFWRNLLWSDGITELFV